jgi:hypothetical protein
VVRNPGYLHAAMDETEQKFGSIEAYFELGIDAVASPAEAALSARPGKCRSVEILVTRRVLLVLR